jgi:hypothetical protein
MDYLKQFGDMKKKIKKIRKNKEKYCCDISFILSGIFISIRKDIFEEKELFQKMMDGI